MLCILKTPIQNFMHTHTHTQTHTHTHRWGWPSLDSKHATSRANTQT